MGSLDQACLPAGRSEDDKSMKKIVFIGGGGGVTNIAPGLRDDFDVTAIITSFDDGGSYGTFRRDYKNPLTGDIRRALAALSMNGLGKETEFRFEEGVMKGHTLGNILLASVFTQLGDGEKAMERLHELFAVKGAVLPVSYDLAELQAELKDRSILRGEHIIDEPHAKSHIGINRVWLDPDPKVADGVLHAIEKADLIITGPGDLYCSTIPSFLVEGIAKAVQGSSAKFVYICNRFTKYGQTNNFTASEHVRVLSHYAQRKPDTIILNTSPISEEVIDHHREENESLVEQDIDLLKEQGYDVILAELLAIELVKKSKADTLKRSKIKMDPNKINTLVHQLLDQA